MVLVDFLVCDMGLGNRVDKFDKNWCKMLGMLCDLIGVLLVGVIECDDVCGVVIYGKLMGVVVVVCLLINLVVMLVNKVMMVVKVRNVVIILFLFKGVFMV